MNKQEGEMQMNRKAIEALIRNDYDWIWPPKSRKAIINKAIYLVNKKSGKDSVLAVVMKRQSGGKFLKSVTNKKQRVDVFSRRRYAV